jgi:hypothetical protein
LAVASPVNYQIKTGSVTLDSVGESKDITIYGQNRRFWITDFVPSILNADGTIPDGVHYPVDDLLVHIKVGTMDLTDRPMPLSSLLHKNNDDLFSGQIIEPNNSIVFKITAKQVGNMLPKCKYPLTIYVTLKGYDIPDLK